MSIPQNILDVIYSVLIQLNLKVNKFVSSNYLDAHSSLEHNKEKLSMVFNLGYRSTTVSIFDGNFLIDYKTLVCGVEQVVLALATKSAISIEDARLALKEVPLFGADERDWVSYSGKYFRLDKISSMINFYIIQMAYKILDKDYFYVNDLILTGWCREIKGIDGVFKRFATNVTVVPDSIDEHYEKIFSLNDKYGGFAF